MARCSRPQVMTWWRTPGASGAWSPCCSVRPAWASRVARCPGCGPCTFRPPAARPVPRPRGEHSMSRRPRSPAPFAPEPRSSTSSGRSRGYLLIRPPGTSPSLCAHASPFDKLKADGSSPYHPAVPAVPLAARRRRTPMVLPAPGPAAPPRSRLPRAPGPIAPSPRAGIGLESPCLVRPRFRSTGFLRRVPSPRARARSPRGPLDKRLLAAYSLDASRAQIRFWKVICPG